MTEAAVETPVSETTIAPELLQLKEALRKIVGVHTAIKVGFFPFDTFSKIKEGEEFLQKLHVDVFEKALAHPDFDKDEDLKALKERKDGQAEAPKTV